MIPIPFREHTLVFAKNQPEYQPLPALRYARDPAGRIVCCWALSWRERLRLLCTGRIWHTILTFDQPLQPQLLQLDKPFTPEEAGAARAEQDRLDALAAFRQRMETKYGQKAKEKSAVMNFRNFAPNDRRRLIHIEDADFAEAQHHGLMFLHGCRLVNHAGQTAIPES